MTDSTAPTRRNGALPVSLGAARMGIQPPLQYPAAVVNVTNRCNLRCTHCYLYADGNPNDDDDQMSDEALLAELERLRDRHGLLAMVWQGGEPMIRWRVVERGVKLFAKNTVTTNGTIPLRDFGPHVTYVISIDGPERFHEELRGEGTYAKTRANILSLPKAFSSTVQVQCVVTQRNQHSLEELVRDFVDTPVDGMTFSFYCPNQGEDSPLAWSSTTAREEAIDIVFGLKAKYAGFIWNSGRALELMRAPSAKLVTDHCPTLRTVLPLYVENRRFVSPFCCYGNNVDCDRCGGWVVFAHAAKLPGPWDAVLPPREPYDPLWRWIARHSGQAPASR